MASITERRNSDGELTGYKILSCVGRDDLYKQVWKSTTVKVDDERIAGLTPKKRQKELEIIADALEKEWKAAFKESPESAHKKAKHYTLEEAIQLWIDNNAHHWKPQTERAFKQSGIVLVAYFGSRVKLGEISRLQIDQFVAWAKTEKGYSYSTVHGAIAALKGTMGYAVEIGALKRNAASGYILKNTDEIPEHVDYLTQQECADFLRVLEMETVRLNSSYWECFGLIVILTGLRKGRRIFW